MVDRTEDRSQDRRVLRTVYTFFLGVLLALFVGLGIATVHPGPEEPEPPRSIALAQETRELTPEEQQQWVGYELERRAWEDEFMRHSRDVGVLALVASVLLLAVSLAVERRRPVLAHGILLGGLFTLLHSVVRSMISQDTLAAFGVVTVALVVVLYLGYRRFVDRPTGTGDRPGPSGTVVSDNGKHPSRR
ncbi:MULTISPECIES: hypothetical protein [Kocuria]|uniref:Uncharacterized protein n=1 Tax=Kocuria rosea subsp. polaris TaxID=136273 RepID=A0A0W8I2Y4_KOCRO|nr:hypothetical protein [Kocuria polaris]KUG52108.1 hypothetical protein AVL61_07075 [Kocuria polaris]